MLVDGIRSQHRHTHVSAWHAVNHVCCDALIDSPEQIIATKLRHETYAVVYAVLRYVEERPKSALQTHGVPVQSKY